MNSLMADCTPYLPYAAQNRRWPLPTSLRGSLGKAWAIFALLVFTRFVPIGERSSDEILSAGLSPKNYLEILGVGTAGLWILWTLWRNRIRLSILYAEHMRWFVLLCAAYMVSASWSLMPMMTIYRVFELLLTGTLIQFILRSSTSASKCFLTIAYICMLQCAASAAFHIYTSGTWPSALVGALQSNPGGGIAAVILIYIMFSKPLQRRWRLLHFILTGAAFILFGSLASFIAIFVAVIYILITGRSRAIKAAILTVLLGMAPLVIAGVFSVRSVEGYLATLSGKTLDEVQDASGRLALWQETSGFLVGRPFGAGYVAGERLMVAVGDVDRSKTWDAASCHDGYLSAWVAAGPIGFVLLLSFLGSLYRALGRRTHASAVWRGILILLIVNNLTLSSLGGQVDSLTLVALAVAAVPFTYCLPHES